MGPRLPAPPVPVKRISMNRCSRHPVPRPWGPTRLLGVLGLLAAVVGACADEPVAPDGQPFGRIGGVRIEVSTPLSGGKGELRHMVEWSSNGPWRSVERISYGGR